MPQYVEAKEANTYIERPGDDSTALYATDHDEVPASFGLESSALDGDRIVNGHASAKGVDAPRRRRSESWKMKQRGQLDASGMSETRAAERRRGTFAHQLERTGPRFLERQCHGPCRPRCPSLAF